MRQDENTAILEPVVRRGRGRVQPPPIRAVRAKHSTGSFPTDATDVLEIGAGTGILTRLLAERVDHVTAVEPDERMRAVLAAADPRCRGPRRSRRGDPRRRVVRRRRHRPVGLALGRRGTRHPRGGAGAAPRRPTLARVDRSGPLGRLDAIAVGRRHHLQPRGEVRGGQSPEAAASRQRRRRWRQPVPPARDEAVPMDPADDQGGPRGAVRDVQRGDHHGRGRPSRASRSNDALPRRRTRPSPGSTPSTSRCAPTAGGPPSAERTAPRSRTASLCVRRAPPGRRAPRALCVVVDGLLCIVIRSSDDSSHPPTSFCGCTQIRGARVRCRFERAGAPHRTKGQTPMQIRLRNVLAVGALTSGLLAGGALVANAATTSTTTGNSGTSSGSPARPTAPARARTPGTGRAPGRSSNSSTGSGSSSSSSSSSGSGSTKNCPNMGSGSGIRHPATPPSGSGAPPTSGSGSASTSGS